MRKNVSDEMTNHGLANPGLTLTTVTTNTDWDFCISYRHTIKKYPVMWSWFLIGPQRLQESHEIRESHGTGVFHAKTDGNSSKNQRSKNYWLVVSNIW